MRLTTAKYYTPSHNVIHGRGIIPNIVTTLTPDQEAEVARWRSEDDPKEKRVATLAELDDHQLTRAADTLKGVLVYKSALESQPLQTPPDK